MSSPATPPARVLSFEEARRLVEHHAASVLPREVETVNLLAGIGRVLAERIVADRDFPPFRRATRDGYAVRASDLAKVPARLEVVGEIKAGAAPESQTRALTPGQAIGIMTGAPLPEGADAVVMVEYTLPAEHRVEVRRSVRPGENFVPHGAEARAGQVLIDSGRRLDHAGIAIAASVGKSHLEVFQKPRVAVLSTGDEVVDINATPRPTQIRNSNSYSLAAQVHNAGGDPVRLPIAPDEPMRLQALIDEGLGCDLLLLTGGVSMGKYDLVEQVLTGLQAEFYFTGVDIQPGKPAVFGSCGAGALARLLAAHETPTGTGMPAPQKKFFFGLPGNPVSTMVTFELFAKPMLEALAGLMPQPLIFPSAKLKSEIRTKTGLKRFLPAVLSGEFEKAEVELAPWQGSGDIAALARANCYVVIPPDRECIEAGEWVSLLMR
ncbi:MAG TPA: gephyrin-like molybdotransferase Glp [Terriglobales bacterium]|jgi:molybdopterin molybdotransferase|nr:gephyrin-like molybdotransferase Glp [Terriglobales bacterium]